MMIPSVVTAASTNEWGSQNVVLGGLRVASVLQASGSQFDTSSRSADWTTSHEAMVFHNATHSF